MTSGTGVPAPSRLRQPLRVLFVPHLSEMSGAPWMAVQIARGLDAARFERLVVCPGPGPVVDRARAEGLDVEVLGLLPLSLRQALNEGKAFEWVGSRWKYVSGFRALLERFRPDVVYIHSAAQIIPGLLAKWSGIPVVWHIQETLDFSRVSHRIRRWWIKRLADSAIFCGWAPRDSFLPRPGGQPWTVAPNALTREVSETPPDREAARKALGITDARPVLVMVGGVHPRKGLDVLLQALGRLRHRGQKEFTLLVAGGTESAPLEFLQRIQEILEAERLRPHVRMLGHRDDVLEILSAADVFVLTSRSEGLPLSVVEAFALGVPAVLTDAGDCAVLTGDGTRGYTVPRDDPEAFAEALARVLAAPEERLAMGRRAGEYARKHFQFSRLVRDVSRVLEETARDQDLSGGSG